MGNAESQHPGQTPGQAGSGEMRQCYYEVLEVERSDSTTADDIKKAYRRLALRYHPDKNHENTQEAAEKFIQIQAAYEVLSDEQERAWYDSHREQILRGHDGDTVGSDSAIVGTTVADLMKFFDPSTYARMNDSQQGFYTIVRTLFTTLDREEEAAARESGEDYSPYPSFGNSKSDPKTEVRRFYSAWMGFSTVKSFSWRDQWRYSEAPDRRVKRAMEKDNKRHRDAGRREFNDTVKSLVMFIRKRDPRYVKETVDEAKLQATLLAASQSQAAKAKAEFQENLKSFQTQEWMEAEPTPEIDEEDEESEVEEEFECVACKKIYKNEKQFDAHLKGKKHIKAVKELRKAMREEDFALGVSDGVSTAGTATPNVKHNGDSFDVYTNEEEADAHQDFECLDEVVDEEGTIVPKETPEDPTPAKPTVQGGPEDNTAEEPRESADKAPQPHPNATDRNPEASDSDSEASLEKELDALFIGINKDRAQPQSQDTKPKIGAAKAKRQKRAEKLAALEAEGKAPPKRKQRKPYDPVAAMQKARGETVTSGRKGKKK